MYADDRLHNGKGGNYGDGMRMERGFQEDCSNGWRRERERLMLIVPDGKKERESQFWWALTPGDDDASLKPAKVYPNHDRFTFLFLFAQFVSRRVQRVENSNWIFDNLENGNRNPGESNKGWRVGGS